MADKIDINLDQFLMLQAFLRGEDLLHYGEASDYAYETYEILRSLQGRGPEDRIAQIIMALFPKIAEWQGQRMLDIIFPMRLLKQLSL